jgi:hypothetical protein
MPIRLHSRPFEQQFTQIARPWDKGTEPLEEATWLTLYAGPSYQRSKDTPMHGDTLYRLTYLAAALSFGHHIDHVIRHNAVGWPLTGQVNAFTVSLVIYPIIITGLLLYRAGRVGPGFWPWSPAAAPSSSAPSTSARLRSNRQR